MYGDAFQRHIDRTWNSRITFPNKKLYLFDDDVKCTIRYPKYHPDVAGEFSFIISKYLMASLGQTFGSTDSPQNWEPLARAQTHLAAILSPRRDLLSKYDTLINQVKFSPPPDPIVIFTPAVKDSHNHGIPNPDSTYYNIFVDDSLYVHIDSVIRHSMAASIEVLYMILGYPDKSCAKMLSVWTNSYNSSAHSSVISSVCYSTHDR